MELRFSLPSILVGMFNVESKQSGSIFGLDLGGIISSGTMSWCSFMYFKNIVPKSVTSYLCEAS